jgi:RNA polymerase sigma-70 factor (ECF subfamily)
LDNTAEENLLEACCQGDSLGYETLVRKYSKYVFTICFGVVGNKHDAQDLAQKTFMRVFQDIKNLKDKKLFRTWMHQIAKNICVDFLRNKKREKTFMAKLVKDTSVNLDYVVEADYGSGSDFNLLEVLSKLKEKYREVLMLHYFNEISIDDIADILDINKKAVQGRLSRGRKQLRELLKKEGEL